MDRLVDFSRTAITAACVVGLLLSLESGTADARERPSRSHAQHAHVQKTAKSRARQNARMNPPGQDSREPAAERPEPKVASNRPVITRTENGYTREQSVTNGKGETSTRSTVVERDPETGTYSKTSTFTHFDGRTHSKTVEVQKTDTSYSRTKEITHTNGSVTSQQVDATYDPATNKWSRSGEVSHTKPPAADDAPDTAPAPVAGNPVP